MNDKTIQILLTNDDSIHSPGLWAAAEALDDLGFVHVVAPMKQQTAAGRSLPIHSSGTIEAMTLTINGKEWPVYAVDGSPGQSVLHGVYDVIKAKPDLVVSGINYGENIGSGITISGTVGAALEAASLDIPALAVSMETQSKYHLSLSKEIDFSAAGYFTQLFAAKLLSHKLPFDVDILKIDVPEAANRETPWVLTRQSRQRYYIPKPAQRENLYDRGPIDYFVDRAIEGAEKDSDVNAIMIEKKVSVTPISIDLTSRTDFSALQNLLSQD